MCVFDIGTVRKTMIRQDHDDFLSLSYIWSAADNGGTFSVANVHFANTEFICTWMGRTVDDFSYNDSAVAFANIFENFSF